MALYRDFSPFTKVLLPSGSSGSNAVWVQVNGWRCPEFLRQPKGSLKIQTATQFFLLPSSATGSGRKRTISCTKRQPFGCRFLFYSVLSNFYSFFAFFVFLGAAASSLIRSTGSQRLILPVSLKAFSVITVSGTMNMPRKPNSFKPKYKPISVTIG